MYSLLIILFKFSVFFFLVCIKFLSKFDKSLSDEERKDQNLMTQKLKKTCMKAKNRENRFVSLTIKLHFNLSFIL